MVSLQNRTLERRVGMNRGDYKLGSLHQIVRKPLMEQPEEESTLDLEGGIYGPPVTESDEESLELEEKQSAPVPTLKQRKGSDTSIRSFRGSGLDVRSSSHESISPPRELSNAVSVIPAESFFSSSQQESNKKRNSSMVSGDFGEEESWKPKKKPKKIYKGHSTKLDTSPKTEKMNQGKTKVDGSSSTSKTGGPVFRTFDTEPMISQVKEMEEREAKNQAPLQLGTSPRAQRALSRSNGTQKITKKGSLSGLKIPEQTPSPKSTSTSEDGPKKFIMPLVLPDGTPTPRATKLNKSFKMPETIVTLSDIQAPPPFSSITASSLPSTLNDAASSSSVSSPPSSPEIDASIEGLLFEKANVPYFREPPTVAKCPFCKKPVERGFLEGFERGGHLNIRQQLRFCNAHRARTADSEWEEKGYPKIDWQHFDERLAWFHRDLDEILQGKRPSFYRNAFEDHLKSGRNRTLLQALSHGSVLEGLVPGYYGSRGAKLMMDNIMTHFAPRLRHLAASDKLLSSGGVSGYVQAVLAPELAVMLVMQDMGTDEEGARAVLRDSVEIGNLLNEEEDEVINDPEPRDELEA